MNRVSGTHKLLSAAAIVALIAASWLLWPRGDAPASPLNAVLVSQVTPAGDPAPNVPRAATARRPLVLVLDDEPADSPKPREVLPAATIAELEARFRAERETSSRSDIIAEIAGHNDAAAVGAIARLFRTERHPAVKEALLAGLADIGAEAAPAERLGILAGALHGQPRNVRTTAIDLLGQSDDPREIALLKKAAAEDPDNEIRETARAILEAGESARDALRAESGR